MKVIEWINITRWRVCGNKIVVFFNTRINIFKYNDVPKNWILDEPDWAR
jgi:hypothetical protein